MKCFVKVHLTLGFLLLLFRIAKCDNSDEDDKEEEEFGGVNIKVFRGPSKKNGNETFAPFGYHVKMPPIHSSKFLKKKVVKDQEKPFDFNTNDDEPFDFSSHESDIQKETSDEQDQNEEQFGFTSNEHDEDEKDLSKEHAKDDDDFSGEHHAGDDPNVHNRPFDGSEEVGDSNEELDFENQERSNRYNHFHNYNKDNHPKPRHHDYLNEHNNERSKPLNYVSKNYDHRNLDQNVPFVGESTKRIKKRFNDFNIRPDGVFGKIHSVGESHDRYKMSDGSIIPSSTTNRFYNKYIDTIPTDSTLRYYNQDKEYKSGILPAAIPVKDYNYNHYKEYRRSLIR